MRRKFYHIHIVLFIIAFTLTGMTLSCSSGSNGGLTNEEQLETLAGLGIDITDIDPILDAEGDEVSGEWNPLGKKFGRFSPKMEFFYGGAANENNRYNGLNDDSDQTTASSELFNISAADSSIWSNLKQKQSLSADIDGDGIDEMMVVYAFQGSSSYDSLNLQIINRKKSGTYETKSKELYQAAPITTPTSYYFLANSIEGKRQKELQAVSGDFDNDGASEILLAWGQWIYMFDDEGEDFKLLEKKQITRRSTMHPFSLAAGNLDKDPGDEFIVSYTYADYRGYYTIYDGSLDSPFAGFEDNQVTSTEGTSTVEYGFSTFAIGDFDGDKLNEIAWCSYDAASNLSASNWILYVRYMDDFLANYAVIEGEGYQNLNSGFPQNADGTTYYPYYSQILKAFDCDGDNRDELLCGNMILPDISGDILEMEATVIKTLTNIMYYPLSVDTGNTWFNPEYEGDEELSGFFLKFDTTDGYTEYGSILTWGYDNNEGEIAFRNGVALDNLIPWYYPVFSIGDVDNDSPVLKYTGDHEVLFTNPIILATLASPPYWEGIGQNTNDMDTYLGTYQSSTATSTNHLGFSIGVSVGYEVEVSALVIKLGSFKMTAELEAAFDWTFSSSTTVSKEVARHCVPGENRVIFTSVPHHVYYYKVVASEDSDAVGTTVCINVPLGEQTRSVTIDYYNEYNGDLPDIDTSVYSHSFGDVSSYPTKAQMQTVVGTTGSFNDNCFTTDLLSVPQGSSSDGASITIETATTEGYSIDTSLTVEVEAVAGGVVAGASAGFQYGYAYDLTTVSGATYGFEIGGIPSSYYNDMNYFYETGLFVYPHTIGDNKFQVLNFWVE